jgi:hypothetical protein
MIKNKKIRFLLLVLLVLLALLVIQDLFKKNNEDYITVLNGNFNDTKISIINPNNTNLGTPLSFDLFVKYNNNKKKLGTYDIDGWQNKYTELNDIFVYKSNNFERIIVIIKEDTSRPMIEIIGTSYQLIFYDTQYNEDVDILKYFDHGRGFEGSSEGEEFIFQYKARNSIIKKLKELGY